MDVVWDNGKAQDVESVSSSSSMRWILGVDEVEDLVVVITLHKLEALIFTENTSFKQNKPWPIQHYNLHNIHN